MPNFLITPCFSISLRNAWTSKVIVISMVTSPPVEDANLAVRSVIYRSYSLPVISQSCGTQQQESADDPQRLQKLNRHHMRFIFLG